MEVAFIKIFNMSVVSIWLILAVIILRMLLKNAPKWIRCVMWAMVDVRLVVPFSFESSFSVIPNAQEFNEASYSSTSYISSGAGEGSVFLNNSAVRAEGASLSVIGIISLVWFVGVVIMLAYMLISYVKLSKTVRERIKVEDNIWICDRIKTPFVLGIFRPKIYLLPSMSNNEKEYVIAHEKTHLKRLDNIWKPLGFILLSIHWFNPLCWIAYWLFNKDIELACDEKVVKELDLKGKKDYSTALLMCSSESHTVSVCPLAFGENNIKHRIKSVLGYKKPALRVIVISFAACAAVAASFMTDPLSTKAASTIINGLNSDIAGRLPVKLNADDISKLELNKIYSMILNATESDNLDKEFASSIEKIELNEQNKEILVYIKNLDENKQDWFEKNICDTPYVVFVSVKDENKEKPTEPPVQDETQSVTDAVAGDVSDESYYEEDYSDSSYADDSDSYYDDYSDYSDDGVYSDNSDNSDIVAIVPITPFEPDYDYYNNLMNDGSTTGAGSSNGFGLSADTTQKYASDDLWHDTQWDY